MIIWLASYPKSGNTWVRLFLNSLFKSKDSKVDINNIQIRQFPLRYDFDDLKINVDNIQEFVSNCILCQNKINLDNSIKFFNLGSENQWQKLLCKQIIKKIETSFKEEMTELKYL